MTDKAKILSQQQPFTDSNGKVNHSWYRSLNGLYDYVNGAVTAITGATTAANGLNAGFVPWNDLAGAIAATAAYAQTISPVQLIANLSGTGSANTISLNEADGKLYKWVDGAWVAYVSAPELAGQLTADQIVSLNATQIAGQLVAGQLSAASVLTSNLTVGSSTNLCWNACMEIAPDGWSVASSQTVGGWGTTYGTGYAPTWRLPGLGTGFVTVAPALTTSDYMSLFWCPNSTDTPTVWGVPTTAGAIVEASAQLMPHRCGGRVAISWCDASGAAISASYGTRVVQAVPANGEALTSYAQSWVSATAPAGAFFAAAFVEGFNDGAADIAAILGANPYLFFTQFSIGPGIPNSTSAQPWSPGGVSSISGGMIKTRTLQADRLLAYSISANEMGVNSVIAGTIAAGAVNAAEIAAGSIETVHLASTFQLTANAQIGNAIIQNANIANLTVGTNNMANNSISNTASATGNGSASFSIVTNGSAVVIIGQVLGSTSYNPTLTLSRNGGAILSYQFQTVSAGIATWPVPVVWVDYPGSGTFTYTLACNHGSSISPNISFSGFSLMK